jgi:hypothetical protein
MLTKSHQENRIRRKTFDTQRESTLSDLEEFPAEYFTLVTKQNIDRFEPYDYLGSGTAMLIFARDALSEYDYHVNTGDHYGFHDPRDTYFPWELNQFVKDADRTNMHNEVVFHDPLNWRKMLKAVMFKDSNGGIVDINGNRIKSKEYRWSGAVMPRIPIALTPEERVNRPFTETHKSMLPQLCSVSKQFIKNAPYFYSEEEIKNFLKLQCAVCKLDSAKYDFNEMAQLIKTKRYTPLQSSGPVVDFLHDVGERADEIHMGGREDQDIATFIRAYHEIHAPGYTGVFALRPPLQYSPPALLQGGYRGAHFGLKHVLA